MKASILLVAAAALVVLTGCNPGSEAMCKRGEYPAWNKEAPATGRMCVKNGQTPPEPYATYPPGHVPHVLDDDYNPIDSPFPAN